TARRQLLEQTLPDWVVHCAALADLEACEADPPLAKKLNTDLPAKLAEDVSKGGARLLHVSTDAVFDGQRGDYSEEDEPHPLSTYAKTKLAGERAVLAIDSDALVVRVNFYGWSLNGERSLAEFFFNNLSAGKEIPGFVDVFFCPLLANDLAQILLTMMQLNLKGLYHVVAPQAISKYEFGVQIAQAFDLDANLIRPISVTQAGLRAARSPKMTLSVAKLQKVFPQPLPTIQQGLQRFVALYREGYPERLRAMSQENTLVT
ncbi:MAG: SDR family oxidoreductase, partial [Anaerolineales bacterium]|nr:SDR family oxidoreductase [Anaerolineales bacterium]